MQRKINKIACFVLLFILTTHTTVLSYEIAEETTGEYVRAAEQIVYGDLFISAISEDGVMTARLKVIEQLKGDLGKKELEVVINMRDPNHYRKFKSDLTNLNISASEDILASGSSLKKVIMMMRKVSGGYEYLRAIPLFRPDKLELYLYSYKEIVSMTKITDKAELLKTIRYNFGEEFTYSLYNHCADELFKLDISFGEIFKTVKEFLDYKGERKVFSWFNLLSRTGKRLERSYNDVDEKVRDEFFSYLHDSYTGVPADNEYVNKRFLDLLYDFRRLILKDKEWQKKFSETLETRKISVDGLAEDHFRNEELKSKWEKLKRSLSK